MTESDKQIPNMEDERPNRYEEEIKGALSMIREIEKVEE